MYMPSESCSDSGTLFSSEPSRLSPFDAIRSRPRLSFSSSSQISRWSTPSFVRRSFVSRNACTNGDSTQRVAWPGAVSSSDVASQSTAICWNAGWIAPELTASSVKRYAVPISTPTFAPRDASFDAIAATIADERPSWMPPANTIESSSGLSNDSRIAS